MPVIHVKASQPYDVKIECGIFSRAATEIAPFTVGKDICIVSDDTVFSLYGGRLKDSLTSAGYRVTVFVFPHGEDRKCPETLVSLWGHMASARLARKSTVIALGGGVVGDLAGFAAATYMRGVSFIQIPTTLLAAVDSSVGGKTAVNLPEGKNLAGAFYQPNLVLCDPELLKTLPGRTFNEGMAEVIKYAVIGDTELLNLIKCKAPVVSEIIAHSVDGKRRLAEFDEKDTGIRQYLNFGHTLGHAVEHLSNYRLMHGEAVAVGMAIALRGAVNTGACPASDAEEIIGLLKCYSLPTETEFTPEELVSVAKNDKKCTMGGITFVLPRGIGKLELQNFTFDELLAFTKAGWKA